MPPSTAHRGFTLFDEAHERPGFAIDASKMVLDEEVLKILAVPVRGKLL